MTFDRVFGLLAACLLFCYPPGECVHHPVISPCPIGQFPCNGSDTCVEQRLNCDGKADCEDSSDEWHCEDKIRKDFWNSLFRKRVDEDREKKITECGLTSVPSQCRCSELRLFCERQGLKTPPPDLPPKVRELDLSDNSLNEISAGSLPLLRNLETLIVRSSKVTLIYEDALSSLPYLKNLHLTGNHIAYVRNATFLSNTALKLLVLSYNPLTALSPGAFLGLYNLVELDLRDCRIRKLPWGIFEPLDNLKIMWLDGNELVTIPPGIFFRQKSLSILSLSRNHLQVLDSSSFEGLNTLKTLSLSRNRIYQLESNTFGNLTSLLKLDLNGNEIHIIGYKAFASLRKLESLDLRNNEVKKLHPETFHPLTSLKYTYFDEFYLCFYAQHVRVCEPRGDGISSIAHLLDSVVLRVSVWIVAVVACLGNVLVLIGRILFTEPNEVHSFYIKNLSLADLLMGIYLFIIASYDVAFRGEYIKHEHSWRHSWQCNFSGFLSTLSSEVSVFILTVITVDRYTSIIYPLTLKRRTIRSAVVCMVFTWTTAIILAGLPVLNIRYYGDDFYGNNGVCLPLHIHDPYAEAWEYSTFLFCGINMSAFIFILFAYISMFLTITSSKIGLRSTQQLQDRTIAKRFAFIVGTDFVCWVPIVLIKFISMAGVPIQEDLYAWVAVFLLPVNCALNPVLYTLTTKLFKQHIARIVCSCRSGVHASDSSGITLSSILHHRGSKKALVASLSENDHSGSNKWSLLSNNSCKSQHRSSGKQKNPSHFVMDML